MIKHLVIISLFLLCNQKSFAAAELLVKSDTVSYSGYSALSDDKSIIYGGVAGNACTDSGSTTCNSCKDTSGGVNACNQSSIYSGLKFSVSFKLTKAVTGVAKLFIESSTAGTYDAVATIASQSYTTESTITLETTWEQICLRAGITGCSGGTSSLLASKSIRFGVDSDNSGDVEDAERKAVTATLHFIPPNTTDAYQAYCATSSDSGVGVCNLSFLPGDGKVFIDSAIYKGEDSGGAPWESIAVFPVAVTAGGESNAYTNFTNGVAQPVFKTINTTDGSIPDSQVAGSIENYQKYCLVYATRNKAQNIYKFVTSGVDTTKSCVTPSEVVGVLDDKHCFISTAAFGSESAPEVEVFRKFRNQFMLDNYLGRKFVKVYYSASPPIAEFISQSDYLRAIARMGLYPLYLFAFASLKIGFFLTLVLMLVLTVIAFRYFRKFPSKNALLVLAILLTTSILKAEVIPEETKISHPQAEEGLVKIKKDGTYVYDVKRPLKSESSRITFGQANHPSVSISIEQTDVNGNPTGSYQEYDFKDFYSETSGYIIGYDYEWFPFSEKARLGVQAGISAMVATGNGKLVATPNPSSVESYTFATLPLTLGGVYRLEWKDKQLFAPYVSGGGTYVVLAEKREDKPVPHFIGGLGFYGSGGVLFNIGALDPDSSFQLESEYGISNMWLALEFRMIEVNGEAFSFSNQYVNAGFSFDF